MQVLRSEEQFKTSNWCSRVDEMLRRWSPYITFKTVIRTFTKILFWQQYFQVTLPQAASHQHFHIHPKSLLAWTLNQTIQTSLPCQLENVLAAGAETNEISARPDTVQHFHQQTRSKYKITADKFCRADDIKKSWEKNSNRDRTLLRASWCWGNDFIEISENSYSCEKEMQYLCTNGFFQQ